MGLTADIRRPSQTVFFPPDDLSGGKPACPAGKQVLKRCLYSAMENINSTMILYRHNNKNTRAAIDVFFAARVAR
jgi:hypothetical protein